MTSTQKNVILCKMKPNHRSGAVSLCISVTTLKHV